MSNTLSTFSNLQGVIGTCVFNGEKVFGATLPGFGGQDDAIQAFTPIQSVMEKAKKTGLPLAHTTVTYGDTRILFSRVDSLLIAIFHQEDTDLQALISKFTSHRDDIQDDLDDLLNGTRDWDPATDPSRFARAQKTPVLLPIRRDLQRIRQALVFYVGPAGAVLLDEALEHWIDQGPIQKGRLDKLVSQLATELPIRQDMPRFIAQAMGTSAPPA